MAQVFRFSPAGNAAPAVAQDANERRTARRRRILKSGIIAYNDRYCTVPATVRDISDTGTGLVVEPGAAVPDTFELLIPSDGLEADCEVVWRRGNRLGVRFLGAVRHVAPHNKQVIYPNVPQKKPGLRRKDIPR
ncbi:MAG: PilZ domain-containing protein [Hyphomicrobiaceae bacterium]